MKKFNLLAAVAVLIALCAVSYYLGRWSRQSDYEAACLQADFIHSLMDQDGECWNMGAEVEESYEEWFQDLDYGVYNTKSLTREELRNYYWCY